MGRLDELAAQNSGTATLEQPTRRLDQLAAQQRAPALDLPSDPDEQDKVLNNVLEVAQKTGLPLQSVEPNHVNLGRELAHTDQTWKEAQNDVLSPWKPTILERIRNYFYIPAPPGGFDRSDKPLRTAGKLGLIAGVEAVSGLLLRAPDIAAAKLTGEPTAAGALAKGLGIERTPREEAQGELVRTLGEFKTLGMATGPLIAKLPARESLRIILHSGVTLGTAETVDQVTEKITEGKPFDIEGIHFSAGLGVLFGVGAVGIDKFARFIRGVRATKDLAVTGKVSFDKGKFPSSRAEARAEINAALKVRESDPAEWQRVVDKYSRGGVTAAQRQAAMKARAQPSAVTSETTDVVKRYPAAIQRASLNADAEAVNSLRAMAQIEVDNLAKAVDSDISSATGELKANAPKIAPKPRTQAGGLQVPEKQQITEPPAQAQQEIAPGTTAKPLTEPVRRKSERLAEFQARERRFFLNQPQIPPDRLRDRKTAREELVREIVGYLSDPLPLSIDDELKVFRGIERGIVTPDEHELVREFMDSVKSPGITLDEIQQFDPPAAAVEFKKQATNIAELFTDALLSKRPKALASEQQEAERVTDEQILLNLLTAREVQKLTPSQRKNLAHERRVGKERRDRIAAKALKELGEDVEEPPAIEIQAQAITEPPAQAQQEIAPGTTAKPPAEGAIRAFRGNIEQRELKVHIPEPPDLAGIYLSTDKATAEDFAVMGIEGQPKGAGFVGEFDVELNNPASEDIEQQVLKELGAPAEEDTDFRVYTPELAEDVAAELQRRGFDGVIREASDEIIVFDPKQIALAQPKAQGAEGKQPWETSDLATAPNIPIGTVKAERQVGGKWKLVFRGTRNEVFTGELFNSAKEAKDFFRVQQIKAQEALAQPKAQGAEGEIDASIDKAFREKDTETLREIQDTLEEDSERFDRVDHIATILEEGILDKGIEALPPEEQAFVREMIELGEQVQKDLAQPKAPEAKPTKTVTQKPKPKGPKDVTLTAGFDPGLKEFVAQSLKPAAINAANAIASTAKIVGAIPQYSADVFLQPSLELERKSPDAYVSVIKAIHTATDAAKLNFEQIPIEALDLNISQARKYFKKNFTADEQYDFLIAFAGQPGSPDAAQIQKAAFDRLPEEMKEPKQVQAMRELADKNYEYLVDVVGPNVSYVPDYFYGVFEDKKAVDRFWNHWTSTDRFIKKKTIPSVADAIMFGLESGKPVELRAKNFIDNLMNEYLGIAKLDGMMKLKAELIKAGSAATSKPPRKSKKGKPKKTGTPVERRAARLADIYGSAEEALRLQRLQDTVSGQPLTKQSQATQEALKKLVAKEKAVRAEGIEPPPPGGPKQSPLEEFDSLRARSEAEDPDVNVIHPEDINFYITEDPEAAPADWESVADPVFRGAWLRPDLARLIDNLTATNKITQQGILNAVRTANNFTRSLTFFGSAFHLKTVSGAAIADSGWGGPLLHPKRALKPFRQWPSTKQWEKAKQTPEFKRLLGLGVGLGHSAEEAAAKTMEQFGDYIESKNVIGATGKLIEGLALRLPLAFQKWQFDTYIPMLKHAANMDEWALLEKRTGRPATDAELIDIIKGTQNLYGEMNERLLGRSATQTTGSRFVAKAPGFAEGNVRTNIDAGTKFAGERGYTRGRRARSQIVNSLTLKALMATAGTLWFTHKLPKWVNRDFEKEDFADIFKIDTGQVDGRDRRVMINTLDSDKDYLELWFNMFVMRPDRAMYKAFNRLGGMKSTLAEFVYDGFTSLMRQDIRDWKGDKVFSLSDTPQEKLWKYTAIALERLEPIPKSVFDQMRYKEIGLVQSFLGALAGVRPTWSELDKRESEFRRLIFEQKADLEVLDIEILSKADPRASYESYNKDVDRILNSKYLPEGFKEEYEPELRRNVDEYLQNKAFAASHLATERKAKAIAERSIRVLKHFGISAEESVKLLKARKRRMAAKPRRRAHPLESQPIIGDLLKEKRLKERMAGTTKE